MKLSTIQHTLAELGVTPTKSLGQNFLHDQNLARWIVAQLDLLPDDHLVEIGPGLGGTDEREAGDQGLRYFDADHRPPLARKIFANAAGERVRPRAEGRVGGDPADAPRAR